MSRAIVYGIAAVSLVSAGCERETRKYQEIPAASTRPEGARLIPLQAGGAESGRPSLSPYQQNAYGQSEGKRLYAAFNCNGCHAAGGGGIGPALMDDKWIYGYEPDQIYSSIVEGRPNGMPAYGGRIPSQQVWQIVSYLQSLGGQVPQDTAPGRDDDMSTRKPEMRIEAQKPTQTGHR